MEKSNDPRAPHGVLGDPQALAARLLTQTSPAPTSGGPAPGSNGQPGENVGGGTGAPAAMPPGVSGSPEVAGGFTPLDPMTVFQPDPTARRDFIRPLQDASQPGEGVD